MRGAEMVSLPIPSLPSAPTDLVSGAMRSNVLSLAMQHHQPSITNLHTYFSDFDLANCRTALPVEYKALTYKIILLVFGQYVIKLIDFCHSRPALLRILLAITVIHLGLYLKPSMAMYRTFPQKACYWIKPM